MFQTVRHWWGSGHGRITVRLFLFEFVVVMAGVFAAQGLQSWLAGRNDDREGLELISKLVAYGQNLDRVATYWHLRGPACATMSTASPAMRWPAAR